MATVCVLPGSVAEGIATLPDGQTKQLSVEHPTGEFTVEIEVTASGDKIQVSRCSLVRTGRARLSGHVYVPRHVWNGTTK